MDKAFRRRLLTRDVDYYACPSCGYFQTETPDWLHQAYASAINDVDTGILWRNQLNARRVVMTLAAAGKLHGRVVDHAGGFGILVRLLRDMGVDAYWRDKYCENLLARGFEADDSHCDLVTAFEVFEHMEHPLPELEALLTQAPIVLLSTELITAPGLPDPEWWYLGPEHGQHIGFFRISTMQWMANRLGCHVVSDGVSLHAFSWKPMPWYWRAVAKRNRAAPWIVRLRLRSKMMDDFEQLRRAR